MTGTVTPRQWPRAERPLLDRGAERAAIDDLLKVVRRGFGGVLVRRGHHGAGNTSPAGGCAHHRLGQAADSEAPGGVRGDLWDYKRCPTAWPGVPAACRSRNTV
jgi:hypothetical protein